MSEGSESKNVLIRDTSGRFVKGVSGNPTGFRPLPQEIKQFFQERTLTCAETLFGFAMNPDMETAHRLKAIELILGYGIGRPRQALDIDVDESSKFQIDIKIVE